MDCSEALGCDLEFSVAGFVSAQTGMLKVQRFSPMEPTMVGKWVVRKLFDKDRGFAHFYCPCGERWISRDA